MSGAYKLGTFTNSADWRDTIQIFDKDGPRDLTGVTINDLQMVVRDKDARPGLSASYAGGTIKLVDAATGLFSFKFLAADTAKLKPGEYDLGGTLIVTDSSSGTDDVITDQVLLGKVQCLDGVVGQIP